MSDAVLGAFIGAAGPVIVLIISQVYQARTRANEAYLREKITRINDLLAALTDAHYTVLLISLQTELTDEQESTIILPKISSLLQAEARATLFLNKETEEAAVSARKYVVSLGIAHARRFGTSAQLTPEDSARLQAELEPDRDAATQSLKQALSSLRNILHPDVLAQKPPRREPV
jgi:hypothetical protein